MVLHKKREHGTQTLNIISKLLNHLVLQLKPGQWSHFIYILTRAQLSLIIFLAYNPYQTGIDYCIWTEWVTHAGP